MNTTKMKMPLGLNKPEQFFWKNAGWGYTPGLQTPEKGREDGAVRCAWAERKAQLEGMRFKWEVDEDVDRTGIAHDSPLWQCLAYADDGAIVQSLSNIDLGKDADPWMHGISGGGSAYARVVEAELALEHFGSEYDGRVVT